ncbi:helix-turn-helix domain-containing protein [Streptomyces somaliensis]|uniref:Helix-turn-helix domain-containing protein n=1 Tax=Streptomyces somaliensis (strain ATCC 33201 / DSM 40738 / JCM 12659 / KCTC 9044 / NCTC 11332 / NRRL B-12077 / IP 733) TaxID=1134445 RepID=A0AA44DC71_STRE0|nr:IclR family transcriptional regulator C-terminal domain-containing protein [Streptomyces somaliensis]MCP9945722.1 helix-turn-helix domain-containing protein [Streptomyces somaliensis]MCP9961101.1 helix-turn-helix domain-containing protein [Streptomyces somaliensis]MCP9973895.1 helix-turn-helix domain-containing protein [Streptomyces somaliensis]MCQ0022857.1 helix-turn-helix domain-containing protein [Streptomyces somaliensis DSM 40738]NKY14042.1 helix-turn-helix domain-containing protein [S
MALKPEPTAPFHSVQYALRVLETVSRHGGGVTDAQIARETGLPAAHLTPLLRMLRREGYVEQVADGAYVVGDSLVLLGSGTTRRAALEAKLQETLTELRDSVGAAVYVSRYIDGEVKITQMVDGPHAPKVNEWVDFRSAAHASAVGKCLLTQLDQNGRRDHLARHKIARLTSRTITNERVLFSRLDSQPPTVPVLDLQEYAVGTVCAAVPLTAGASVGCLALSLPIEHAHRLRSAADALNRKAAPVVLSLAL